jgi:hypothetical protein
VPLIQRLSSGQFVQILDDLDTCATAERGCESAASQPAEVRRCKCGCGERVVEGRKFVNQDHYSLWLSHERFFGKNRRA